MYQSYYRDLIIILILSAASLIYLYTPALNEYPLNLVPIILLLLFLPGYSVLSVVNPLFNQTSLVKRVLFSIIVSLIIFTVLSLLWTYIQVHFSIYLILVIITVLFSLIGLVRRRWLDEPIPSFRRGRKPAKKSSKPEEGTGKVTPEEMVDEKIKSKKNMHSKPVNNRFLPLDLLLILILTILTVIFVLVPALNQTILRTVLGLLLVLFIPGYSLIAALFPKKDDLSGIERLALSFGLSIALTPLIGLVLNYTAWGIRLDPILVSLTGVTLLLCAVAFIRRRMIPEENRFLVDFEGFFGKFGPDFIGQSKTSKILSIVLILSIIFAIATTAYIMVTPKEGESFTEFYILGPGGKASDYPTNLTTGQEGKVIIGIVNHENKNTSYHLIVTSNDTVQMDQTLNLKDGEKVEIPFSFTAGDPEEKKMEFLLYKLPDNNNIYRSLHLWINVTGS